MGESSGGCVTVGPGMLSNPVEVRVHGLDLDFDTAQKLAALLAGRLKSELMLMGWYDRKAERHWPAVECCGHDKPAWLIYAESRGADIAIDINDQEYVFVFRGE